MLLIVTPPSLKAGPANSKILASFVCIANLLTMLEHFRLALKVAFFVHHEKFSPL
jgi:hypothetical protein